MTVLIFSDCKWFLKNKRNEKQNKKSARWDSLFFVCYFLLGLAWTKRSSLLLGLCKTFSLTCSQLVAQPITHGIAIGFHPLDVGADALQCLHINLRNWRNEKNIVLFPQNPALANYLGPAALPVARCPGCFDLRRRMTLLQMHNHWNKCSSAQKFEQGACTTIQNAVESL